MTLTRRPYHRSEARHSGERQFDLSSHARRGGGSGHAL